MREAQLAQYNYILVVGASERSERTVNVRTRDNVVHGMYRLEDVASILSDERAGRVLGSLFEARKGARLDTPADGGAAPADGDA